MTRSPIRRTRCTFQRRRPASRTARQVFCCAPIHKNQSSLTMLKFEIPPPSPLTAALGGAVCSLGAPAPTALQSMLASHTHTFDRTPRTTWTEDYSYAAPTFACTCEHACVDLECIRCGGSLPLCTKDQHQQVCQGDWNPLRKCVVRDCDQMVKRADLDKVSAQVCRYRCH